MAEKLRIVGRHRRQHKVKSADAETWRVLVVEHERQCPSLQTCFPGIIDPPVGEQRGAAAHGTVSQLLRESVKSHAHLEMGVKAEKHHQIEEPRLIPGQVDVVGEGLEVGQDAEKPVKMPRKRSEKRVFLKNCGIFNSFFRQICRDLSQFAAFAQILFFQKEGAAGRCQI